MKKHVKNILIVVVFATISIFMSGRIDTNNQEYKTADFNKYRQMAKSAPTISTEVIAPFGYRIAGPWLAGTLFENIDEGFALLNFLSLFSIAILLYFFFIANNISKSIATLLSICAVFNRYFYQFPAWNTYHIADTFAFIFLLISFLLILKKNYLPLLLLMPIAVLMKEYILLIIPFVYTYLIVTKSEKKAYLPISIASALSIAMYVVIHQYITLGGGESLSEQIRTTVVQNFSDPLALLKRLIIAFTPFGLIPLVFFRSFGQFCKQYPYYLVFLTAVLCMSFLGVDAERLIVTALPVYLLFIGQKIESFVALFDRKSKRNWLIQIGVLSVISSLYHIWGIIQIPSRKMSIIFTGIVLISMLGLFLYLHILMKRAEKLELKQKIKNRTITN